MTKQTPITEQLNNEMLEIALRNFDEFCQLTGFDVLHAYVCLLKTKGKSYGQIAVMLKKSRDQIRGIHRRNCGCIQPQQSGNVANE